MGDEEKRQLLNQVRQTLDTEEEFGLEMILFNPALEGPGIWLEIEGYRGYLGQSMQAAMFTAVIGDWIVPSRQGPLIEDDIEWFERRATLGHHHWVKEEPRMMYQERRTRIVQNVIDYGSEPLEIPSLMEVRQEYPELFFETQDLVIAQIADWPGYWLLNEDRTFFRHISLTFDDDTYRLIFVGDFREFKEELVWKKVAILTTTHDDQFVELKFFGDDQERPLVAITQDEETGKFITRASLP